MRTGSLRKAASVAAAVAVLCLAGAAPAGAHAEIDLDQTRPRDGTTLQRPPSHVRLHFTEPPGKQASVTVTDGCGEDAIKTTSVSDNDVHVFLKRPGERGEYEVSFAVVSAVDGHPSKGEFSFTVSGEPDCSDEPTSAETDDDGDSDVGAGGSPTIPEDESSFPVVPVAIGSVALIGIAFIARRLTAG